MTAVPRDRDEALAHIATTVRHLVALDVGHGARATVPAAREAVRRVPELLGDARDSDLLAALAELCEVTGWILFDAGLHRRARRVNAYALALAERCGDRWTARIVLLNDSMLLAHTGRPLAALEAVSRVAGPRGPRALPPRVGSLVLVRQAHATAMLGAEREAAVLIARARDRFLDGVSDRDPHWAWWIDETELLGHHGWVLARLRRQERAVPLLHRAVAAPGPSYRHLFAAELLSALVGAGAWRDAEQLIVRLAPGAAGLGSARTAASLARTAARLLSPASPSPVPPYVRDAGAHLLEALGGLGLGGLGRGS